MNKDKKIAELESIVSEQASRITQLEELLRVALDRISELEARLKMDSRTSDRPPSSDVHVQKPAFPRKKGGKLGGKPGHKGNTLKMVIEPDHVLIHTPEGNCCCGRSLSGIPMSALGKRQVFDLPPVRFEVTEHVVFGGHCSCGQYHRGAFPGSVNAPTSYGEGISALLTLLSVEHGLPVGRIKRLCGDLFGHQVNEGTIMNVIAAVYDKCAPVEDRVKELLRDRPVAHFDETGARVAGKRGWIHNVSDHSLTYCFFHEKRGGEALNSPASILPDFGGIAVHDRWYSYFTFDVEHALCNAHILRSLKGLSEHHDREWSGGMHDLLMYLYEFSDKGRGVARKDIMVKCSRHFDHIIDKGNIEEPPADRSKGKRPKKTKGRNLLEALEKYKKEVLTFAGLEQVPFTNNQAERDIRPWKTKLKVSGSFRSAKGADYYARIKSVCSTARKNGINIFNELRNIFNGQSELLSRLT